MNRQFLARLILVAVTAVIIFFYYTPLGNVDFANNWRAGSFGFSMGLFSPRISELTNPKLIRAGVRTGDVLDVPQFQKSWAEAQYPRAGQTRTMTFRTARGNISETLTASGDASFDGWQRLGGILAILPATVFLVVAFMLVWARPSVMTWTFFVFAVGYFSTKPAMGYFSFFSESAYDVLLFFSNTLFGNFAALPLIPFVLRFPNNDMSGWRKKIDVPVWIFLAIAFALYVWEFITYTAGRSLPAAHVWIDNYLPLSAFFISALIVIKNGKTAAPETRQRLIWLIGGTLISFFAYAVYFVPDIDAIGFVSPLSDTIRQVVGFAAVLMPISVAYAVFRHRVIDVNFVVNRAIVYGALSVVLLAMISLLDWLSSRILGEAHLAAYVEALVTIGLGFLLNRFHQTMEGWVDRFLFWRRHQAENYLKRVATALPFSTSEDAITDGLVHEPVEALDLSGAALYLRGEGSGRFKFAAAHRASPMFKEFDENHNLVRFLHAEESVVWLDDIGIHRESEIGVFVVAVPVIVRHELIGFTLYGAHRSGAQIDPDEIRIFEELAVEAARAYDHVEAVRTRERLLHMQRRLDQFEQQPQLG